MGDKLGDTNICPRFRYIYNHFDDARYQIGFNGMKNHKVFTLRVNDETGQEIDKLAAQGWELFSVVSAQSSTFTVIVTMTRDAKLAIME